MISIIKSKIRITNNSKELCKQKELIRKKINNKLYDYIFSEEIVKPNKQIVDEFYKSIKLDSKSYKNLISLLFTQIGIQNSIARVGDNNFRTDLILKDSDLTGIVDIGKSEEALESPRNILEQNAIFFSRYNIKDDKVFIVVSNHLPRLRQDYWKVLNDIKKILNIDIKNITTGTLFLLVLLRKKIQLKDLENTDITSIGKNLRNLVGHSFLEDIPLGYKGIFEIEK
tara:strand:- start:3 stop:683 length:681 start_codon:yes stop_codon:yes gene_type:complete